MICNHSNSKFVIIEKKKKTTSDMYCHFKFPVLISRIKQTICLTSFNQRKTVVFFQSEIVCSLFGFYGISIFVSYLMPNPLLYE